MKTIKRLIALCLCITSILLLSACDDTNEAYIYFTLNEQPSTLDPQIAKTDTELMIIRNIFEGLLRKDENGKIVCGAAESFEKDGLTYTFNLRKDAKWSNEEAVTAYDFLFALQRAVNPKTKAPFAKRLINIKNADKILRGEKSVYDLGVKALDTYTLQIKLSKEDKNFEEALTTSIAMPCNETFFNFSAGKYGLESETTISNGSYRLTKWGKTVFGIRLYRNKYYKGDFIAKNAAVFLSTADETTPLEILKNNDADIAFITSTQIKSATDFGLKTARTNNICWFLTVSDGFTKDIRKALITLGAPQTFSKNLIDGYYPAESIFPDVLKTGKTSAGMPVYDLEVAKEIFFKEISTLKDKKFPENVVLYYYNDGFSSTFVTDIVGHWQNQLGAYINIEAVSSPQVLEAQLNDQTYALSIFPISADSPQVNEYLEKFGIDYNGSDYSKIQSQILNSNNIAPLATQDTIIAYNTNLENLNFNNGNGCIDFAYIIKND